jgi:predicted flavoprotein YhiN
MNKQIYDFAVIGAGPAGMMAALHAAECGAKVTLLEKNRVPGIKLLMTGKERCNITSSESDVKKFISVFGKNGKFLMNALHRFGVRETIDFFHENNLSTKVERGGRIFPVSDKAEDVQQLFLKLLKKNSVILQTNCNIKKIVCKSNIIEKIITDSAEIKAHNYLISTGGLSYPKTGSTGDGYRWAREMGHKIIEPMPALTPVIGILKSNCFSKSQMKLQPQDLLLQARSQDRLAYSKKCIKELEGLSLKNVKVSVNQNGIKYDERFGEALFTSNGMSGPIILDLSKSIGALLAKGQVDLFIDFKPALDLDKLDKRILRDLDKHGKKAVKNLLLGLLPKKLVPVILHLTEIDPEKRASSVSKEERKTLRLYLKQFPLTVNSLHGFSKAIITAGGVCLKEIDPKTMRSKIVENLYFAGEIIDLDGPTGGYNLQVCWSTGFIAGNSAAERE